MSGSVFTAQPPYFSPSEDAPLTPKIQNKRRSLVIGEPISDTSSSSNDDSPSSFDCQSLQRSLKRVRLTCTNTTPGELRLERDLRHAVVNQLWRPRAKDEWQVVTPPDNGDSEHDMDALNSERIILPCNITVTVTRDEQDPMELILRVEELPDAQSPTSSSTTLHLHVPRLYPHRPPVVRRIDHTRPPARRDDPHIPLYPCGVSSATHPTTRLVPRNHHHHHHPSNRWVAGNFLHTSSSSWENSAPLGRHENDEATLLHRRHRSRLKCPSALQSIMVASSPEMPFSLTMEDGPHHSGTICITQWTPVHRITDLIDWLVAALLEEEESSLPPPMPRAFLRNDEKKEDEVSLAWQYAGGPMVSSSDFALDSESEEDPYQSSYHGHPTVEEDWISDGEQTTKTSSRRPQLYDELADPSSFLPPNRFHVGYHLTKESFGEQDPCEDAMDISLNSD